MGSADEQATSLQSSIQQAATMTGKLRGPHRSGHSSMWKLLFHRHVQREVLDAGKIQQHIRPAVLTAALEQRLLEQLEVAERDGLALLVRDLEAHHRLSRDHLDDAHADRRQRARGDAQVKARLDGRLPLVELALRRLGFLDFMAAAENGHVDAMVSAGALLHRGVMSDDGKKIIIERDQRRAFECAI